MKKCPPGHQHAALLKEAHISLKINKITASAKPENTAGGILSDTKDVVYQL